jgi:hypothetical protein
LDAEDRTRRITIEKWTKTGVLEKIGRSAVRLKISEGWVTEKVHLRERKLL